MKLGEYVLVAQEHRYIAGKLVAMSDSNLLLEDVYLISIDEEEGDDGESMPLIGILNVDPDEVIAEKLTTWMTVPKENCMDVSAWSKELCKEAPAPKPKRN